MRILIPMLLLPVLAFAAGQSGTNASSTINVMPLPAFVQAQPGKLKLDGGFTVSSDGYTDGRLQAAILRLQQRLEGRTGMVLPLGVVPNGKSAVLRIGVRDGGAAYPKLGDDESYALVIDSAKASSACWQTRAWRAFLSRRKRSRAASSSCGSRSKVMLAGW